jgi:molybdenum cofactor guanylyltransferase
MTPSPRRITEDPVVAGDVTGIVLAGGRSSRFGRDKLRVEVAGAPLVHHAIAGVAVVADDVVVVLAPGADEPALPAGVSARFGVDASPDQGPLAGALAGLSLCDTAWALLVGGDMPELSVAVLREMLRQATARGVAAVALRDGARIRPLPAVLDVGRARIEAARLLASGTRTLRALVAALAPVVIDEATWVPLDPERRTLLDIDEPGDVSRLERPSA